MKGNIWVLIGSLVSFVFLGLVFGNRAVHATQARSDRTEVQDLRRELQEAKATLDQMKRLYDTRIKELQERLSRVEESEPAEVAVLPAAATDLELVRPGKGEEEIQLEQIPARKGPLPLIPDIAGTRITGFIVGSMNYVTAQRFPGTTPGDPSRGIREFDREVAALTDPGDVTFRFDSFNIGFTKRLTDWLLASAAIEVENDRAIEAFEGGIDLEREQKTEVEIDTFEITGIAPIGNGLALSFGKYNVPFGIEREDAPFNLQATNSLVFELGRPSKMLGFRGAYQFNPIFDLQLFGVNGWNVDEDNNSGKTFAGRLGITPIKGFNIGIGGFWGPEQNNTNSSTRRIIDVDAVYTRIPRLTLASEFVYGAESDVGVFAVNEPNLLVGLDENEVAALVVEKDVNWIGFALTGHYDFSDLWGLTLRYGYFNDMDGGRTGFDQHLHSFTIAPLIHLSNIIPGLGFPGYVPRTDVPMSWVDLRLEYRADWSNRNAFFTENNLSDFSDIDHRFTMQMIGMF